MRKLGCGLLLAFVAVATGAPAVAADTDEGLRVFKSANCVGCHKWTGTGGGGYGGAAANLRVTSLDRDQVVELVRCGRPTTGMPRFEPDAYSDGRCYDMKASDLRPEDLPPEPDHYLRPGDIQAVADYVMANVKGHGAPTFAECTAFFGSGSRVCDTYPHESGSTVATATPSRRLAVERAGDANAPAAR